ncbi:MAG TPA: DUF507 family protein [bacterium]|nr:DUF507 family protein [bacterium]
MRLRREMIGYLAGVLAKDLTESGLIEIEMNEAEFSALISRVITEDLLVEDKLDEEVKEILRAHEREIDQKNINYAQMFNLIKRKLVRERGLIL